MITNIHKYTAILFIFFTVFAQQASALSEKSVKNSDAVIEDELLKSKSFYKKIKPVRVKDKTPITDELAEEHMKKGRVFELSVFRQGKYKERKITDELISPEFVKKSSNTVIVRKEPPDEYFIEKKIDVTKVRRIKAKTKYDFTKKQIPVQIRIADGIKSTDGLYEGADIPFVATHDFVIKGKKYKKGTQIMGRIETISDSDKMGVPECIKIDNFYIKDNQDTNLHGYITKTGANRSIWVYPLYQAGNICLYVAGFVFVPIHGGRAKLSTTETFTVFYETR